MASTLSAASSPPVRLSLKVLARLRRIVGKAFVLSQPEELLVYECDACLLVKAQPSVVVLPRTSEEVAAVVRLCHEQKLPFVARGAGTGLSGGALPLEGGVLIGLNRMTRIRAIDPKNRTATVEVGVVNASLNQALAEHNLFYAPDPSSQSACTLGGNIAENAGGIHCIKYGVTTDHVLALEVVLPDGTLTWMGSRTRQSHGLNLTGLMVGSEGTLGIVTQAVLQLLPKPPLTRVFLAAFDHTAQATDLVSDIISTGLPVAALEFMDAFTVRAVNAAFGVGFPESSEAVLLVELNGTSDEVTLHAKKIETLLKTYHACQVRVAETEADRQRLWKARKLAVAAYGRLHPAFYLHDCVIPRSRLTEVLTQIQAIGHKHQVPIGNVFHAGDGNLHPNILFRPDDAAMVQRVLAAGEEILDLCLSVGGTLSGEHGIGIEKSQYMERLFSPADLAKMQAVKTVFDPQGLANPQKIFPLRRGCGEGSHTHQTLANALKPVEDGLWI